MSVDIVVPFPKVRDLSSGKDVVKYAMVATALVPDYITKTGGKDEDRPKEQQDQAQLKDIVMPCEESPEKGKPKILEPSCGDGLEEGDCALGGEDHQLPESGEKDNSGKEEKGDPDPMTEEVRRLVEESKQPFNVRACDTGGTSGVKTCEWNPSRPGKMHREVQHDGHQDQPSA